MRPLLPLLLASIAVGCKARDPDPTLRAFSSCSDMERYMRRVARLEASYDWAWEFGGIGGAEYALQSADKGASFDTGFAAPADDASGDEEGAGSYSGTNLQEADVDEDDLVKTDGTYMYALSGRYLTISKAYPTEEATFLSKIEVDGSPAGIYLVDDYVIAVSQLNSWSSLPSPRSGAEVDRDSDYFTLATVIDVSDREAPVVVRETYASGAFEASRRIDDTLYVVTYEDLYLTEDAESLREARSMIRKAASDDFLPWRMDNVLRSSTWDVEKGAACDCTDVYASSDETGSYVTNVLALDLSDPLSEFEGEAVVGRADTVYASTQAIYVGYSEWSDGEGVFVSRDGSLDSVVHKFDISAGDKTPSYVSTAKVPGEMYSQFALSEHQGILRVATTEVDTDDDWTASASVRTLSFSQGEVEELDSLTGLAPEESIFAVRFIRNIGYIVTYEQTWGDPLFTIDLSDPADIRLAGELAVPGFSNYLHPMDDAHLLSVGMDQDDSETWYLAVSIFDVSDLESPALAHRLLLDASSSEATTEHHAFNYFAAAEVLAIPSYTSDGESVLEVIHATTEGLEPYGRVYQDEVLAESGLDLWCAPVRRSVVMDDDIWAVSEAGLTGAAILSPEETLAAVAFTGTDACDDDYYEGWEDW